MSRMPAASASRASKPPSRASMPSATSSPTVSWASALWAQLAASAALTLRVPARVVGASMSADAVELQLENEAGGAERVRARLVVAADGAHSQVRSAAGIDAAVRGLRAARRGRQRRLRSSRGRHRLRALHRRGTAGAAAAARWQARRHLGLRTGARRDAVAAGRARLPRGAAGAVRLARRALPAPPRRAAPIRCS